MTKRPDTPVSIEQFAPTEIEVREHGFAECPRDYFLVLWVKYSDAGFVTHDDKTRHVLMQLPQDFHILLRGCVEVDYHLRVSPENYPTLMDDTYTDYSRWCGAGCPPGTVWASASVSTGDWRNVPDSGRAQAWAEKLKIPMHEVEVKTGAFVLTLVFHEADISLPPLPEILKQESFWKSVSGKLRSRLGR